MTCFNPIDAWRSNSVNVSGKRSMVFRPSEGSTHSQLPCGKCSGCQSDKSMYWAIRMYHEASLHEKNSFVTFTYRDPAPEVLCKKHLQDFFKRARHHYDFRYFAVGEYGSNTRRPHYHAIIFGEDFLGGAYTISDTLKGNAFLESLWKEGMCSVGSVTMASCCYVAGYVNKKVGDMDMSPIMSRRPGIGYEYLKLYKDDMLRTGSVTIEGKELPLPQRYLQWFEEEFSDLKKERKQRVLYQTKEERDRVSKAREHRSINKASQLSRRGSKL